MQPYTYALPMCRSVVPRGVRFVGAHCADGIAVGTAPVGKSSGPLTIDVKETWSPWISANILHRERER